MTTARARHGEPRVVEPMLAPDASRCAPAPDEVRAATRLAYTDHEGYGTSAAFDHAADVAYGAGRDAAWNDAIRLVEGVKAESTSPDYRRALEAYRTALVAGLRIAARLAKRGDAGQAAEVKP